MSEYDNLVGVSYDRALHEEAVARIFFRGVTYNKELAIHKELFHIGHVKRGFTEEHFYRPEHALNFLN